MYRHLAGMLCYHNVLLTEDVLPQPYEHRGIAGYRLLVLLAPQRCAALCFAALHRHTEFFAFSVLSIHSAIEVLPGNVKEPGDLILRAMNRCKLLDLGSANRDSFTSCHVITSCMSTGYARRA